LWERGGGEGSSFAKQTFIFDASTLNKEAEMQRAQKQGNESENAQRTAQAKFTSKSREAEQANGIDDSPAMIAQRKKLQSLFGGAIQRVEDEEPLQGKFEAVQRVEEEEPLQGKFETAQRVEEEEPLQGEFEAVQRVEEEEPLQGKFEAASSTQLKEVAKPNNTGLPDNLKSGIESLSGMAMDNVKVHYNSSQPAQLNALAYAQGSDIHVAPGQEQHLPHEAWHVVQQAQGRVKPTMQMKEGVPVNDDKSLEHEADVMGAKAEGAAVQLKEKLTQVSSTNIATQLFAVPEGLGLLKNMAESVAADIKSSSMEGGVGIDDPLYGSEQWGKDTYWAANRKLDEWNLVKELVAESGVDDATTIGFGISDTTEADGIGYDDQGDVVVAGENKLVSGAFPQINENINSALSQLTTGVRAKSYGGAQLMARVNVTEESKAYEHLSNMSGSVKKAQHTRWKNRLKNAYGEGDSNWQSKCSLRLLIRTENSVLFDETI
jgi:hypothetical protein